jgi:uncharacterized protein
MNKHITSMLLGALLLNVGCSAIMSEEGFITQDKQATQFNTEYIEKLAQSLPQHLVNQISIDGDEHVSLKGLFIDNPASRTLVFFIQGNGMKVDPDSLAVLQTLSQLGTDIVIFDRRGLGASNGQATIANLLTDATQELAFIRNTYQPDKVIVHGYSLGSFIAAQLVKNQAADALVMQGSATNVDDWIAAKIPWYMPFLTVETPESFKLVDNQEVVSTFYQGPLMVIGGEKDDQVPAELSEKLFLASQSKIKTLIIVPEANHGEMLNSAKTMQAYREFIARI